MLKKLQNIEVFPQPGPITKYKLRNAFYIALVPFFSSITVIAIILIFTKLNLYFLESNGLIINPEIRRAYYDQMIQHILPLLGFFGLLVIGSGAIGYVVVSWATSPFTDAKKILDELLLADETNAKKAVHKSRFWLTESPDFTQVIQEFIEQMLTGKIAGRTKNKVPMPSNFRFIIKFGLVFTALSIISAYTLGIFIGSVYERVLSLGISFINVSSGNAVTSIKGHFFTAQQEILQDVLWVVMGISILVYIFLARKIENYMDNMIWVFSRSLRENRFPLRLRAADLYHDLADTINRSYHKFKDRKLEKEADSDKRNYMT